MVCQFALVPLTLHYLDKTQYGIWLTLASVIGWFSFFDIGIGNGLRNKLSEALAVNNVHLARIYVSTSYALVSIIFLFIIVLFGIINPFLNWAEILNVSAEMNAEISKMVLYVFTFFCLSFIMTLIGNVLYAHQMSAVNGIIGPIGSMVSLVIIYILTLTTESSLFYVALTFSAVPVVVLFIANALLFRKRFSYIAPRFEFVDFKFSSQLLGLGFQFFVVNIAVLVLFSTANIILTQLYGPEEVTVYNIAYKYFTVAIMISGIVLSTYWSAFTEAFVKRDFSWIRKSISKLVIVAFLLSAGVILSAVVSDFAFHLWVGDSVKVPNSMKITMCLYAIINLISSPYIIFINGTGKIRLQVYASVISTIVTIPLAIFFCRSLALGPSGVIVAMICSTLPTAIVWRIQYKKIMSETATGIWNK